MANEVHFHFSWLIFMYLHDLKNDKKKPVITQVRKLQTQSIRQAKQSIDLENFL